MHEFLTQFGTQCVPDSHGGKPGFEERQLLDSLSNHVHAKGVLPDAASGRLALGEEEA